MKIGIIIQARVGSTRLPSKVMMQLPYGSGHTVIGQILRRSLLVPSVDKVILATSTNPENDVLEEKIVTKFPEVGVFRGSEENVLCRFFQASEKFGLDQIIRLTGDNPCIDPQIIENTLADHIDNQADYTYTKGFPLGINVEVVSFNALKKAYHEASTTPEREHVTVFVRNHPEVFKLNFITAEQDYNTWRLTMDTSQDYTLMCIIFAELYEKDPCFTFYDLKTLIEERPYLLNINGRTHQKRALTDQAEEIEEAIQLLKSLDMPKAAQVLSDAK